jgi:hypothetical protein
MADDGPLQLSLFDEQDLAEITSPDFPGERLCCGNPVLAAEPAPQARGPTTSTCAQSSTASRTLYRSFRGLVAHLARPSSPSTRSASRPPQKSPSSPSPRPSSAKPSTSSAFPSRLP